MAALTTTDQLLDLVRKSKLADEKRLDTFLRNLSATLPTRPRELAQLFVRHGLLTPFQASQLLAGKWRGFQVACGQYKLMELLEQRLPAGVQLPPPRPDRLAVPAYDPGRIVQRLAGQRQRGTVKQHGSPW